VRQVAFIVTRQNKPTAIGRILDAEDPVAAIVFCRTRGGVDDLTDLLTARGYQAEALHGGLTQDQRDRVMGRLRSGATELLIATDVAARGLDVDLLTHVINYDLPMTPEAYVHRVGRVGRAGREGVALSLVEPREKRMLDSIEKLTGGQVKVEPILTLTDVRRMRLERTRQAIARLLEDPEARSRMKDYRDAVGDLLESHDAVEVALAAFTLAHEAEQGVVDDDDRDLSVSERPKAGAKGKGASGKHASREASEGPKKRRERPTGPMTRVFVSLGRKAGITPADIVGAFTAEAGLKGGDIGTISVHEKFTMVEVPEDRARKVVKSLQGVKFKGRKTFVRLDRDS
jgi:ATP-dependent RNA helicase DeaD